MKFSYDATSAAFDIARARWFARHFPNHNDPKGRDQLLVGRTIVFPPSSSRIMILRSIKTESEP
mgnify:CR=1 FL=1